MGTTSSTGTLFFTGVSTFSADFQQIVQRAVSIAQLPVTALQQQVSLNSSKNASLQTLNPAVAALGSDVAALGALAANKGLAASSSDASTVSVTNTGATSAATYTVSQITSLAAAASETSTSGYSATQAVSTGGTMTLVAGAKSYSLDLTGSGQNNIAGLANAINNSGAPVSASVLTIGSTNYLSISAANTGATTLQLNDGAPPAALVTNTGTGTETSLQTYADADTTAVSVTGHVNLVVGSKAYNLDVTQNNTLNGLADAINNAGAGLTATVTGSAGNFGLSIVAASGTPTIQLKDPQSADLVSNTNQGSDANFKLNNVQINQSSNNVTGVIPGVSFTLNNTTNGSVKLSLASDGSQLSSALQSMVSDYNALVTQLQSEQGPSAGPLSGDIVIHQISSDMQQLVTFWNPNSSSSVRSLSDLGIEFSDSGQMSFNANTFNALSDTQLADAFNFLGSATNGFAALASNFTQLTDPISGMIQTEENGLNQANTHLNSQIATLNANVAQIQAAATAQAQQADAFVAQLQSQQNVVDASIQSLNYVLYGRQTNANGI
jgi:flagellar hook-associated protein 2